MQILLTDSYCSSFFFFVFEFNNDAVPFHSSLGGKKRLVFVLFFLGGILCSDVLTCWQLKNILITVEVHIN